MPSAHMTRMTSERSGVPDEPWVLQRVGDLVIVVVVVVCFD